MCIMFDFSFFHLQYKTVLRSRVRLRVRQATTMGDFDSNNMDLVNNVRALKIFSGRAPPECLAISTDRRDVYAAIKGQPRSTTATERSTATVRSLAQQEEVHNRASDDLYAILFMVTQKPASLIVPKDEDAVGTSGDGRRAWKELQGKYPKFTDETIHAKTAELVATAMISGQDQKYYFTEATIKHAEVEVMGERMADRRWKDIVVEGFSPGYEGIKLTMNRGPTFDITQIQTTMRYLYLENLSRSNGAEGGTAGRGIDMPAEPAVC